MQSVYAPILGKQSQVMEMPEVYEVCVENFTESISRPLIWDGFQNCHERIHEDNFIGFYWLGGEFLTSNPEPRSAMLLVRVPATFSISAIQQATVDWLKSQENHDSMCDTYFLHEVDPDDPHYELFCEIETAIQEEFSLHEDGTRRGYAIVRIEDGAA
jgi:hypothetical protein